MKYLLFDQNAISSYVSRRVLQSVEYDQGMRFIQHICGNLESEIFEGTAIEYTEDGIIFSGKKPEEVSSSSRGYRVFCIDLTSCSILDEKDCPSDLLTVLQKIFRTALKIWNRQPFATSERVAGSKSIVFPFVMPDHRRVVIERSNSILRLEKRGIDFPLLAYKYSADDYSQGEEFPDTSILKLAGQHYVSKYNDLQLKINQTRIRDESVDSAPLESVSATMSVGRDDFIYWDYERQLKGLTSAQQFVVNYSEIDCPLRIDGAAGTGKTISLIMRAYRLLKDHRDAGTPFSIIFFAHSESTCQRNKETFDLYPDSDFFLSGKELQSIRFTTLLNYCGEVADMSLDMLVEKDAGDAKTYQLLLIEKVVESARESNKIRTYRSLLSPQLQELFDNQKTSSRALYSILQHEFSVQIKGRTDCSIDTYYDIPSIKNGLPCSCKKDKELVFSLFCDYQDELKSMGSFDIDDVVMEALAHLNAPRWRRERAVSGYDYIFVDEMHLFNINEQSVFHFLTKNLSQKSIPICFALDYSQAIGDRGDIHSDYIETAFGIPVGQKYHTVFRNSPQIASFCASIAAAGTLMFQEYFSNPYHNTQSSFTREDEQKSSLPELHLYNNDEDMFNSLGHHIGDIMRTLQCKSSDIAVITFEDTLATLQGVERLSSQTGKQFFLLDSEPNSQAKDFPLASPYAINGLEFKAVILLGVDEGRVPQTAGTSDISKHFINYSAYNLLYLASSRAKYKLIILGNKLKGISSCLDHSIETGHIAVIEH